MKIPKRIKVGGHWIDIDYKDSKEDGSSSSGSNYRWQNLILLDKGLCQTKKESVLLHEIIHEIDWQLTIDLKEDQIDRLAEGLYQVFVDNKFLRY